MYGLSIFLILSTFAKYTITHKKPNYNGIHNDHGRLFQGIGAISGGGATSKLLMNYNEPYRSEILDFLFKPNFGASLQILKVEIGGDSQSSDGAESSHMHSKTDENYQRGYEWWLMTEAKKRNPSIKLYGLPWVFPGWLGGGTFSPYYSRENLVKYIMNWIKGAKLHHNLDIDYIGIWNERPYDIEYIYMLKQTLQKSGLGHIKIVAPDAMSWTMIDDYQNSTILQKSLDIYGYHYPGAFSPSSAQSLPIPLWASEEYSARNDISGGGCWARVLNEGYVNGLFTAYIAWNLVSSYYDQLPYTRSSLMTANQPWSGYYEVSSPIWISAHHTQFTEIGWYYLKHGSGTGNLTSNGTFVSYVSPDDTQLTIVIEAMDPYTSPCFYPMPKYTVADQQNVTFKLGSKFVSIYDYFMNLKRDYQEYQEPYNLVQQAGVWEVRQTNDSKHGKVIKQVVPEPPIDTCRPKRMPNPVAIIGDYNWSDVHFEIDVFIEGPPNGASGVFIGARVNAGGCNIMYSNGIYFWLYMHNKTAYLTGNFSQSVVYEHNPVDIKTETWYTVGLIIKKGDISCTINNKTLMHTKLSSFTSSSGFIAIGTTDFRSALFDNMKILEATDKDQISTKTDITLKYKTKTRKFYEMVDKEINNKVTHDIL